jgi:hypothetical protein
MSDNTGLTTAVLKGNRPVVRSTGADQPAFFPTGQPVREDQPGYLLPDGAPIQQYNQEGQREVVNMDPAATADAQNPAHNPKFSTIPTQRRHG